MSPGWEPDTTGLAEMDGRTTGSCLLPSLSCLQVLWRGTKSDGVLHPRRVLRTQLEHIYM
jgi:hypothetical protein